VRRWFEPQWEYHFPSKASRLERLSGYATEAYARLILPNGFLFKVDTASMKESLEVRVPMLDDELFTFGLSLPHHL
jgi:asparagine synthase (glutamine-hydrolysing)